ncbi:MAG: CNP1-like family protein [Burkholderiales bacterium]
MRVLFLACLFLVTTAQAQVQSDWERANEDRLRQSGEKLVPPPALNRARLVEIKQNVSSSSDFRYYVDWTSVSAGDDRIVRYVLVARSGAGVENVTFEGLRCQGEYRVYAVGRPEGGWSGQPSEWRQIPRNPNTAQPTLAREYFCPGRAVVRTSAEAQQAIRAGGHAGTHRENRGIGEQY